LRVDFSRDRKWAAWTDNTGHLWRSAADGSARLQLTPDSLNVFLARWSPDGSKLALMARAPGKAWQLYMVDADGGEIEPLLRESRNAADPSWSPDGKEIVFGRVNDPLGKETGPRTLEVLHLDTRMVDEVPQSDGLFSPRWSPDGRYIAALSLDQRQVRLFDVATRQWTTLPVHSGADPVWSPDSRFLYLHESLNPAQPIDRVAVPAGPVQELIRLNDSPQGGAESYVFAGLTANNEPLIVEQTFTGNLYSLQLK
jgi:Tol biopolymer transport system component